MTGGLAPTTGQQFSVINYPTSSGSFDNVTGLSAGRAPLFTADQLATSVVLSTAGTAVDLAFDAVESASFPANAAPGQPITVAYTIRNLTDKPAAGTWTDSLYLSRDNKLDEDDILLGRIEHLGGVPALSTYRETFTGPLPALADGSYRVLVLSDNRGHVPDADRSNNAGISAASFAVAAPLLTLGTPVMGTIAPGQSRYFRFTAPPRKDIKVTASFSIADQAELFVRYREPPDRTNYDHTASAKDTQQRILIAGPQAGEYYVLIHGREGTGPGTQFTLLAEATGFEIVRITPLRGSNTGPATIEFFGSQFTPQTMLSLRTDRGAIINAQSVQFVNQNHLVARFDLTGLPIGNYRIQGDDAGARQSRSTRSLSLPHRLERPR